MFSNPLIRRYCVSQLRLPNLIIFSSLYVGILFILFIINGSIYRYQTVYTSLQDLYKSLFTQFLIFQGIILWLLMPINTAGVIPGEIADKSIDFFRMLPLSSIQKTCGILIGRNLFYLIVAAVNFCFFVLLGIAGGVSRGLLMQLTVLMISGMVALNSTALLFSILSFKKSNNGISLLVIFVILCACPFVGAMVTFVQSEESIMDVSFLGYNPPLLYLVSGYIFVGAIWSFAGIFRRFKYEYEPLFSRKGAVLFYLCYLFLVYALFHYYLLWESLIPRQYPYAFALVSLLPLGIIPFSSMRSFDKYIEITHLAKHNDGFVSKLFLSSNFLFNLILFGLWAAAVLAACFFTQKTYDWITIFCCIIFTVYLVAIALGEVYILYQPTANKIGYLLAFIALVYLILPLILAGILKHEYITLFSPIGLIGSFMDNNWTLTDICAALIFNCILLIIPVWLMIKKYIAISRLRWAIESKTK